MKLLRFLTAGVIALFGSTSMASTVLAPTGGSVDFSFFLSGGFELFMFDDEDTTFAGDSLFVPLADPFDTASITISPSIVPDFTAANTLGGELTLTNSPSFIVAICDTSFCYGDTFVDFLGDGAAEVQFGEGGVLVEGVVPAGVAPVPVPAAVWLFGTGLIGLVVVARRRSS